MRIEQHMRHTENAYRMAKVHGMDSPAHRMFMRHAAKLREHLVDLLGEADAQWYVRQLAKREAELADMVVANRD